MTEPINGLAPVHEGLRGVLEVYETALDALLERIPGVQAACPHMQVLHATVNGLALPPLRMCACCRVEEVGTYGSHGGRWVADNFGKPVLGNARHRLVVAVEREQIYALRLPGGRYLTKDLETPE